MSWATNLWIAAAFFAASSAPDGMRMRGGDAAGYNAFSGAGVPTSAFASIHKLSISTQLRSSSPSL